MAAQADDVNDESLLQIDRNNNHEVEDVVEAEVDMDTLIENQQWDQVMALLEASPEQTKRIVNPSLGWTKLHWLCSIGSPAPTDLIAMVARLYPQAITMPDNRYGDTPLHIICRNSVTNAIKLRILLSHILIIIETTHENDDTNVNALPSPPPLPQQHQHQHPTCIHMKHPHITMQQEGLLIRNRFGATALHSACNHNAVLGVIKALVHTDPRIVRVTTHDGVHPISALYSGYVQTIPGTMSVARILRGEQLDDHAPVRVATPPPPPVPAVTDDTNATDANASATAPQQQHHHQLDQSPAAHFDRFWKKVEYLSTAVYTQAKNNSAPPITPTTRVENTEERANANDDDDNEQEQETHDHEYRFVLHGLLQSHGVSLNFYQLALKWNPLYAQVVDEETGNLPLHVLVERRPFRLYERQAIQATLEAYPQAAAIRNTTGDLPLLIAVRNKIPWHNGLDLIAAASPASSAIAGRDAGTGLWPFQLAASVAGRVAVETTFELLKNQPDLLSV